MNEDLTPRSVLEAIARKVMDKIPDVAPSLIGDHGDHADMRFVVEEERGNIRLTGRIVVCRDIRGGFTYLSVPVTSTRPTDFEHLPEIQNAEELEYHAENIAFAFSSTFTRVRRAILRARDRVLTV